MYEIPVAALKAPPCAVDNTIHMLVDETNNSSYAWWSRPLCGGNQQFRKMKRKSSPMKIWPFTFSIGFFFLFFFFMPILLTVKTRHHFPLVCILFLRTIAAFLTQCQPIIHACLRPSEHRLGWYNNNLVCWNDSSNYSRFFFFLINIISKNVNAVGIINKEERPHLSMKDGL